MRDYLKRTVLLTCICTALLFNGCISAGKQTLPADESNETSWIDRGFEYSESVVNERILYPVSFSPLFKSDPDTESGDTVEILSEGASNNIFWQSKKTISLINSSISYTISVYNTDNGDEVQKSFLPEKYGLSTENGYLIDIKPYNDRFVICWADFDTDADGLYRQISERFIITDFLETYSEFDLFPEFCEAGILTDKSDSKPYFGGFAWGIFKDENIYVIDSASEEPIFYVFSKEGNLLLSYRKSKDQNIGLPFLTFWDNIILPVYNKTDGSYEFYLVDIESREFRSFGRFCSDIFIKQIYGMYGKYIYYRSESAGDDRIERWDVESGKREIIFDLKTGGVGAEYYTSLVVNHNDDIFLKIADYSEEFPQEWITSLVPEIQEKDVTQIVSLVKSYDFGPDIIANCATAASIKNPNIQYSYKTAYDDESRTKIMAEVVSGNGPSIMYVSYDDFKMFAEKGYLSDIGELITEDEKELLLPSVLSMGNINGKIMGLPARIKAETMIAAGSLANEDSITLDGIIKLMDEGTVTCALTSNINADEKYIEPLYTVMILLRYGLNSSFLINWEKGESHFEDERFVRLLELTQNDLSTSRRINMNHTNNGHDLVYGNVMNLSIFPELFSWMDEEKADFVGFPDSKSKGFILTDGYIVVNKDADKTAVKNFLQTLLSKDIQTKTYPADMSILKFDPDDYIYWDESDVMWYYHPSSGIVIEEYPDGTNSLDRAEAFLESCTAQPDMYVQIRDIIEEELSCMYSEGRTPQGTAEIIDSRVQLYLDENR